jgi:hypothetical protein
MALPLPVFGGSTPTKEVLASAPLVAPLAHPYDCLVPELWAKESLRILEENMVVANLVHRDFGKEFDNPLKCDRVKVHKKPIFRKG